MTSKYDDWKVQVIEKIWGFSAAVAYAGYLRAGRGAVAIRVDHQGEVELSPIYLTEINNAELAQAIRDYNPLREVVCIFVLADSNEASCRVFENPDLPPPAMYQVFSNTDWFKKPVQ